jgi:biotin carboxylase
MGCDMELLAFTSVSANPNTAKSIDQLSRQGCRPVVVTTRPNIERLGRETGNDIANNAIVVTSFANPVQATEEMECVVRARDLAISNWINITDDTTAFFLTACARLGIDFEFRQAYKTCWVKSSIRKLMARAAYDSCHFAIHDLNSVAPPEIAFPFIAKPILGSGSKGVSIIESRKDWSSNVESVAGELLCDEIEIDGVNPGKQVLVEEVLTGQEKQVDGLVRDGTFECCTIGVKSARYSSVWFREERGILYRPGRFEDCHEADNWLTSWCRELLALINFRNGTFHIEVKQSDQKISLLEVNPRPGGGGNVPAIKRLSGVDLNAECLSLWSGVRAPERQPAGDDSLCFAVRYPKGQGQVGTVRAAGSIMLAWGCGSGGTAIPRDTEMEWIPLVKTGDTLEPEVREQYLGVILAPNVCQRLDEWDGVTSVLLETIKGNDFVEEIC